MQQHTLEKKLLTDEINLNRHREKLLRRYRETNLDAAGFEALAECNFRLAHMPNVDGLNSLNLLLESVKLDGANPKYPYAVARLFFSRGRFDHAATWVTLAAKLCPTSHRIWTHISLLLRELNIRYYGDERFEPDSLKKRAALISEAVLAGVDVLDLNLIDFQPPVSLAAREKQARQSGQSLAKREEVGNDAPPMLMNVRRLSAAGKCRWTGLVDLTIEQLLEAKPTRRTLQQLLPLIERVAIAAETRRGGGAGFAITSAQWIICGYPVTTIRRLLGAIPDFGGPSRELILSLCVLYELPPNELPPHLADAFQAGKLSHLLAALIHTRRVLRRVPEFRGLGAYRTSGKMLGEVRLRPEVAAQKMWLDAALVTARRLIQAVEGINPPSSELLKDEPSVKAAPVAPEGPLVAERTFEFLEAASQVLESLRAEAFVFLKEDVAARCKAPLRATDYSLAMADRNVILDFVSQLRRAGEEGSRRLTEILSSLSPKPPLDFEARRERIQKRFTEVQNLGNYSRVLTRCEQDLMAIVVNFSEALPSMPSWRASDLMNRLKWALPPANTDVASGGTRNNVSGEVGGIGETVQIITAGLEETWVRLKLFNDQYQKNDPPLDDLQKMEIVRRREEASKQFADIDHLLLKVGSLRSREELTPEELAELDTLEKQLQTLTGRRGPINKRFAQLPESSGIPPASLPANRDSVSKSSSAPLTERNRVPPPSELSGPDGLLCAMRYADREIDRIFREALAGFDAYPPTMRRLSAFVAVQSTLQNRYAELLYRLGDRKAARSIWTAMRREDILDSRAIRNLAVCNTTLSDPARCLGAWKDYLEMLQFYDVVAETPEPFARKRADFHRGFGQCFAMSILFEKVDGDWSEKLEEPAVVAFLTSIGRVRTFVTHTILEFLNARFDATSPTLILGVSRAEGEDRRRLAVLELKFFHREALASARLILRTARAFHTMIDVHVEKAYQACGKAAKGSQRKDPLYPIEKERAIRQILDFCRLKIRLSQMLRRAGELANHLTTFEPLLELLRLESIPVSLSDEFHQTVLGQLGVSRELLKTCLRDQIHELIRRAYIRILKGSENEESSTRLGNLYCELVDRWILNPLLDDLRPIIDRPTRFQSMLRELMDNADDAEELLERQLRWNEKFPELAGLAFDLAGTLIRKHTSFADQAIEILKKACARGFEPQSIEDCTQMLATILQQKGRVDEAIQTLQVVAENATKKATCDLMSRLIRQLRLQQAVEQEQFADAINIAEEIVSGDNCVEAFPQNLIRITTDAAKKSKTAEGGPRLYEVIRDWTQRANALRNSQQDRPLTESEGEKPALSTEVVKKIQNLCDEAMVEITRQNGIDSTGNTDWERVAADLTALIEKYPSIKVAYYWRMVAWRTRMNETTGNERNRFLKAVLKDAAMVVRIVDSKKYLREAREFLESNNVRFENEEKE